MPTTTTDYILVGQGLAGSLLAFALHQLGCRSYFIDSNHQSAASLVSAGIINPVTGRRMVRSWRYDEFLTHAEHTYRQLEQWLGGIELFRYRHLLKAFDTIQDTNNWHARSTAFEDYLIQGEPNIPPFLNTALDWGLIQCAQLHVALLLKTIRPKFPVLNETFDHQYLQIHPNGLITYRDITARGIIFCEGYRISFNPFFAHLPYEHAKGECLHIQLPSSLALNTFVKNDLTLAPLPQGTLWAGSNYEWHTTDETTSPAIAEQFCAKLDRMLCTPYQVVAHKAGIRSVLKDRRPILGSLPDNKSVYVFNGLGTKGSSLAPYWATHLAQHLVHQTPIDPEVDVCRFANNHSHKG
jgi:glycine oxidase